jgi:NTE family protein
MKRLLFACLLLAGATRLEAQACTPRRTALVLSGGGAKGLAHVGVLRALDSMGVRPDLVVGTSMGAIIGSLYAAGFTGAEIDSVVRSTPGGIVRSFQPISPRALGVLQPLLSFAEGEGVAGLQAGAVNEREVNALLVNLLLLGNLRARGDFDSLPIPFRAVATDFRTRQPVVLGSGDLALAVRASASIPVVFSTVEVDGRTLVDGGLSANVPVAIARDLGAERVIVSDLTSTLPDSVPLTSTGAAVQKMLDYLFEQPRAPLGPEDVLVRHEVAAFAMLDFSAEAADTLMALGRRASDTTLAQAPCLATRTGTSPRRFRPVPRYVDRVIVTDGTGRAARATRDLGFQPGDSIRWRDVYERGHRLAESEQVDAIWLFPSGRGDSVTLAPQLRTAPRFYAGAGFAYDNVMDGRLWLGAMSEDLLRLNLELSTRLLLGGLRDELQLAMRRNLRFRWRLLAPSLEGQVARERVPQYTADGAREVDVEVRELVGFLGLDRQFGSGWRARLGVEGRTWEEPAGDRAAGGMVFRAERFTDWASSRAILDLRVTNVYRRALAEVRHPFGLGARAGVETLGRAGIGDDLPPHLTFMFGGDDAFPGLEPAERRGERELSLQGRLWYRVLGPVDAVADLGVGHISGGPAPVDAPDWVGGLRLGARVTTPVGPLMVGHGWTNDGGRAWMLRILRWF